MAKERNAALKVWILYKSRGWLSWTQSFSLGNNWKVGVVPLWGGPNSPPTAQPYSAVAAPVLMAVAEVTEPVTIGRQHLCGLSPWWAGQCPYRSTPSPGRRPWLLGPVPFLPWAPSSPFPQARGYSQWGLRPYPDLSTDSLSKEALNGVWEGKTNQWSLQSHLVRETDFIFHPCPHQFLGRSRPLFREPVGRVLSQVCSQVTRAPTSHLEWAALCSIHVLGQEWRVKSANWHTIER